MCNKFVINVLQIYYIVKSTSDGQEYFQITTLWHPGSEQLSSEPNGVTWCSLLGVMTHQDDVIIFCNKIYYKVYYSDLSHSGCVSLILDGRFTDWEHQQCFWASQTALTSSYHWFWSVFDHFLPPRLKTALAEPQNRKWHKKYCTFEKLHGVSFQNHQKLSSNSSWALRTSPLHYFFVYKKYS